MTESSFGARPRSETFEYAGATVELVDAATILAAARVNPVELLRRAMWPAPVQRVDLAVSSADIGGGPKHVFTAEISTADEPLSKERIRALVLGSDPVGVLLAKRIAWVRRPRPRTRGSVSIGPPSRRRTANPPRSPTRWSGCRRP